MQRDRAQRSGRRFLGGGIIAMGVACLTVILAIAVSMFGAPVAAESPASTSPDNPLRASNGNAGDATSSDAKASDAAAPAPSAPPGEHPLDAALAIAHRVQDHIEKDVKDYTCTFIKQERVNGQLLDPSTMEAKFRPKPLSVYFKFFKPDDVKGREVLYLAGANGGKFVAREGSGLKRALGAVWLQPTSALAMMDNRYPITNAGLGHLTKRLIEIAEEDRKYGEVEVHFYKNAKVGARNCTLIEVVHPTPRRVFLFYRARVYIDDELQVPIHYEAALWPSGPGKEPPLDESYTYKDLKLNVGLTDADFDYKNPNYGFVNK
ncbi:MAG TPA: DUF1571 domain-containing protein [Pirellulales bacterium]|jgi:hypothetical protein|nr:DUF1571 domain-containing protein [Pirellulales bacterium]